MRPQTRLNILKIGFEPSDDVSQAYREVRAKHLVELIDTNYGEDRYKVVYERWVKDIIFRKEMFAFDDYRKALNCWTDIAEGTLTLSSNRPKPGC